MKARGGGRLKEKQKERMSAGWLLLLLFNDSSNNAIHLQLNGFFFECCVNI